MHILDLSFLFLFHCISSTDCISFIDMLAPNAVAFHINRRIANLRVFSTSSMRGEQVNLHSYFEHVHVCLDQNACTTVRMGVSSTAKISWETYISPSHCLQTSTYLDGLLNLNC